MESTGGDGADGLGEHGEGQAQQARMSLADVGRGFRVMGDAGEGANGVRGCEARPMACRGGWGGETGGGVHIWWRVEGVGCGVVSAVTVLRSCGKIKAYRGINQQQILLFYFEPWFSRISQCACGGLRTKTSGFWQLNQPCGQKRAVFGISINLADKNERFLSVTRFYGLISNRRPLNKNFSFNLA
jgi:hypothetical protein